MTSIQLEDIRDAAERGDATAQNLLGMLLTHGNGIPKDLEEAFMWFMKAANQGCVDAQFNVATCYEYGDGVDKNLLVANNWYRQAAEQDYDKAQYALGQLLATAGRLEEAVVWYQKAAANGNSHAQNSLGFLYDKGNGVEQNEAEAARLYYRAALQGHPSAQNNIAVMLDEGRAVPVDHVEAYKWYNLASAKGVEHAKKALSELSRRMTRNQIAEAQKRTADFVPKAESVLRAEEAQTQGELNGESDSDVTQLVERLEAFEGRLGVRLEALSAMFFFGSTDNVPWLRVCGELHPTDGATIEHQVKVVVDAYDSAGRLLNTGWQCLSDPEKFFGFETFTIQINTIGKIAKVRVYPKPL